MSEIDSGQLNLEEVKAEFIRQLSDADSNLVFMRQRQDEETGIVEGVVIMNYPGLGTLRFQIQASAYDLSQITSISLIQ